MAKQKSTITGPEEVAFGSTVTFDVYTEQTNFPWVEVLCHNDEHPRVYGETKAYFGDRDREFVLGPTAVWTGGPASGTATLFSYDNARRRDLALFSFDVTA
jgi:hypothetical protein